MHGGDDERANRGDDANDQSSGEEDERIEETDAIFENVARINAESDAREDSLRISIDGKAKLKIGDFSRGGSSRGREPVKAFDHDFAPKKSSLPLAS